MKAMILAAGMGERLEPLTKIYPKVLVPVANRPMMEITLDFLKSHGIQEIIINAHHHYKKIIDYLKAGNCPGSEVEIRVETEILGTGGGIKNTQDFWDKEPFIVINGDILTDIDLNKVYEFHVQKNNLITMVLHDFPLCNKIKLDDNMNILSIGPGTNLKGASAFTGIHVINPEVLEYIPEDKNYNIIECYKKLIDLKKPVRGYMATGHRWIDIGAIADYLRANIQNLPPEKMAISNECLIDPNACLDEWAVIGKGSSIESNALIKRSILWNDVIVRKGIRVVDSIVTSGVIVERDLFGQVIIR
ncbi:MAG TPA: NDP-sugar synthase [Desulfatiglandales bacterium]|nr:NDP-sugar synthase [Desulfatiglandales bacterium]